MGTVEHWNNRIMGLKAKAILILNDSLASNIKQRIHSVKPIIPTFHPSNALSISSQGKPLKIDLAQRTRFSMII